MDADLEGRRKLIEARVEWCQRNLQSLDRDRRLVPGLFLLLLLAIPAGWKFGWIGAALAVLATLFTVAAACYLIWGHRTEYVQKIADLQRELAEVEQLERARRYRP
jgi:hypothetical protein